MNESFIATTERPLRVLRDDAILAGMLLFVGVVLTWISSMQSWYSDAPLEKFMADILGLVMVLLLSVRRTHPVLFAMFTAVTAGISFASIMVFDPVANGLVLVGVYSAAAFAPKRLRFAGLASLPVAVLLMLILALFGLPHGEPARVEPSLDRAEDWLGMLVLVALISLAYLAAFGFGVARRGRLEVIVREQAERRLLEQDAHRLTELAVADERARISREMHDIIAHSLASIVTLSEGGRFAAKGNAELSAELFDKIADTGRDALTDVKRLLRNVEEAQEDAPAQGPEEIDELVERTTLAGLPIEYHVSGVPRPLPAGLGLAVYRVAQESITNVLKHAPGARTVLRLEWGETELRFSCENVLGANAPLVDARPRDGRGIQGMRERVELFEGKFSADIVESLFRVNATWPIPEIQFKSPRRTKERRA